MLGAHQGYAVWSIHVRGDQQLSPVPVAGGVTAYAGSPEFRLSVGRRWESNEIRCPDVFRQALKVYAWLRLQAGENQPGIDAAKANPDLEFPDDITFGVRKVLDADVG